MPSKQGDKMTSGLLLVDLQNDYFPGGLMELVGIQKAAANAQRLLSHYREKQWPVIHVQHLAMRPGSGFFLPGTQGADIHVMLAPREEEDVVRKHYPNSFRETLLGDVLQLKHISRLVICGAMSHMCIDATTRAAFDLGFDCTVAEDACATRDLFFGGRTIPATDVHGAFMAALSSPYANVVSTRGILADAI
jgi:nicotinamidase-related amidase